MSTDAATDRENLTDLQQGEGAALNRLIGRWQRPLLNFAFRYLQNMADAQDVVAETFVKLHQRRMQLRADTNMAAWLFTSLSNLCHNHHRWKRRHPTVAFGFPPGEGQVGRSGESFIDAETPEASPDAALAKDESLAAIRSAVEALPHDLKVTVLLHHYEHLSYREIAAISGCSERGVETRLYRARQQLKAELSSFFREGTP